MEYHEPTPSVLMLHDGELDTLTAVIESLGGVDRRGNPSNLDRAQAWDVIVASAGRMLELDEHLSNTSAVRIAVLDADSKTLRKMLNRVDTDLLVRQPVHPAALRLLILHALYRGPEKRRATRVSMGAPVRFRSGLRRRPAILAELSIRGCRMMVDSGSHRAVPDKLVTVVLPPGVTHDKRSLSLRGHVLRTSSAGEGTDVIAVLFELLRDATRKRLESIVAAHSNGPAVLDETVALALDSLPIIPDDAAASPVIPKDDGPPPIAPEDTGPAPVISEDAAAAPVISEDAEPAPAPPEDAGPAPIISEDPEPLPIAFEDLAPSPITPEEAGATPVAAEETDPSSSVPEDGEPGPLELDSSADEPAGERRIQGRHSISRRIVALGDEAARVLIGRDLSIGGMRVDSTPGLAVGDRLKVAVHIRPDGQPLVVSAEITRDDGPDGMALRFVDLSPAACAYLAEMVVALPTIIEPNQSKEGAGVVVSEVVGRRPN